MLHSCSLFEHFGICCHPVVNHLLIQTPLLTSTDFSWDVGLDSPLWSSFNLDLAPPLVSSSPFFSLFSSLWLDKSMMIMIKKRLWAASATSPIHRVPACVALTSIWAEGFIPFIDPCFSHRETQQVLEPHGLTGHRVQHFLPQLLPAGAPHTTRLITLRLQVCVWQGRVSQNWCTWVVCVHASPYTCCCYMVVF